MSLADSQIVEHVQAIEKSIKDGDVKASHWMHGLNGATKHIRNTAKRLITKWKEDLMKSDAKKPQPDKRQFPAKVSIERKDSGSPAPSTPTPNTPSFRERSYKLDKVVPKLIGDKVRDKTIELLYAAIGFGSDDASSEIMTKAGQVEAALFREYNGVSDKYKSQFRTLLANLKDKENPKLRENLLSGALLAEDIVTMGPEDMMSDELKKAAEEARRKNMMDSMTAPPQEAETDAFKCGKCGKRKCTYYQKQTRSADEPMYI
ncbi:RNA polymerase II elongation factor [Dinochytrium kinnereticum]|nr:RNA polymerase II elongation factor [Dinochytrium kinnereticum]